MFRTRPPYSFFYSPGLRRELALRVDEFDVVGIHSMNLFPQLAAYRRATHDGVPYILSPHGALHPLPRSRRRIRKAIVDAVWQRDLLKSAAAFHVHTAREADLMAAVAPGVECHVIPNGVVVARFADHSGGRQFREEHLDGYEGPLLMYSGRVSFAKGVDILVRALPLIGASNPDVRLAIVGPDDENAVARLQTLAEQLDVARMVTFTGPMFGESYVAALSAADVWALPSHSDNFGTAAIEALAADLPVVLSDQVDIAPEVAAASAAVVAAPKVRDFADRITQLLRDEGARKSLRARGSEFARLFDWATLAPQYAEMYRGVFERANAGR